MEEEAVIENDFDLQDCLQLVVAETGIQHETVEIAVKSFLRNLKTKVIELGHAQVYGFGSFHTVGVAPREGTDPHGNHFSVGKRIKVEFNAFLPFRDEIENKTGTPAIP